MLTKEQVLEKINNGESFEGDEIGEVNFSKHIFDRAIDFKSALFKNSANFGGAIFQKEIDFSNSQFDGDVSFTNSHFKDDAIFSDVMFQRRALFLGTQFEDDVSFLATQFLNTVYFGKTKFKKEADFIVTNFGGHALFSNISFSSTDQTSFNGIVFQKPEQVIFQIVDLSKCSFTSTNLSKIGLTDIIWPIKKGIFDRRKIIYDEIANKAEEKNYAFVEKAYRDLKKNYENRGSYGEAGDFHYGEMEMRRLSQGRRQKYLSLTALYCLFSGYGEKYVRAIFWLGAFLLVYIGTYWSIEYNSLPFRDGLWNSFVHALEVITFQRSQIYPSVSPQGKLADMVLTIAFSLQATLTILAIKRKFKR
ncbi:MAG: pentapeptide repeat-containing protein [Ignavibacteriales bacterium]|nr:pentapeptide repeat-containing protein [Ignavibacteriales bacterium]